MPDLTLFTSPKPFSNSHIALIQRNAIRSWTHLGKGVEVFLLGNEPGVAEAAKTLGVHHIKEIKRNASGTPLISDMFATARQQNDAPLLACVNADILLFPEFLSVSRDVLSKTDRFLMVGQRWDLDVTYELDFSPGWVERLKSDCRQRGSLHKPTGSDYFIFPRGCFTAMPDFAIGRAGWDNWMIYQARRQNWKTIDATASIQIIHQSHDYSHLPGGQAHYHLPETDENVRLAGGRRTIFTLLDADYSCRDGRIQRVKWSCAKCLRELEIFPLITLKSIFLGELFHLLLHPRKLWAILRNKLTGKKAGKE